VAIVIRGHHHDLIFRQNVLGNSRPAQRRPSAFLPLSTRSASRPRPINSATSSGRSRKRWNPRNLYQGRWPRTTCGCARRSACWPTIPR
jgi:hypothetical protein